MTSQTEKIGLRIRKLRKELGLTQEELAEKAKIDPKSVIEIEGGKRNPTVKSLSKIATALGVKLSSLIEVI